MRGMLGFAVIDAQTDSDDIAVWLTSRMSPTMVDHTNAVTLHRAEARTNRAMRSMIADRVVVLTPGTTIEVGAPAMTFDDLALVRGATSDLYDLVVAAIAAHKKRTRTTVVTPSRPEDREYVPPTEDVPALRALATANYLAWLWRGWLVVEEERRRRTVSPRTQESPWMMPPELGSTDGRELPESVTAAFPPIPVGAP